MIGDEDVVPVPSRRRSIFLGARWRESMLGVAFFFRTRFSSSESWRIESLCRQSELEGCEPPRSPLFGVEAPPGHDTRRREWDLLTISDSTSRMTILEEVKGGDISRDDRNALWRRVRKSFRSHEGFSVRLTVDADNLPSQATHWAKLAATSAHLLRALRLRRLGSKVLPRWRGGSLLSPHPGGPDSRQECHLFLDEEASSLLATFQFLCRGPPCCNGHAL